MFHTPNLRAALSVLALSICLWSCSKAPEGGEAGKTPDVQVATPNVVDMTGAGAPKRADGYWEMKSVSDDGKEMAKQFYCVGGGSEDKFSLFDLVSIAGECSKKSFTRTPAGWQFETVCAMASYITTSKGVISGDFNRTFRIDQEVLQTDSTAPKGTMIGTTKGAVLGKRLGECPSGVVAGDLLRDDGSKLMNMSQ